MPRLWHANCSVRAVSPLSADLALAEEAGFASGGDFDLNWSVKLRPSNGSARGRAEQDPIVQRMKEKFKAEIRTVIDYREKG